MRFLWCILLLSASVFGQHPVRREADATARYYRLICLVHLVGSGKHTDPIRPEYVPAAVDAARHAFDAILADKRPEIRVFEIGKDSRAAIEAEMQKHKAGFDLSKFAVVAR